MFKPRRMSPSVTPFHRGRFPAPPRRTPSRAAPDGSIPPVASERHPPPAEPHPFLLQEDALGDHAAHGRPETDAASRVHHAVPRHARRHAPERAPHHPRVPRIPEPRRNLPVSGHVPPRNIRDETPHLPPKVHHVRPAPNCSS